MIVRKAITKEDYARCVQIRTIVFTVGQSVPASREVDEHEDTAVHFLAVDSGGQAIGAGRWRRYDSDKAKLERLAVLDSGRGKGVGKALMQAILDDIRAVGGVSAVVLGSQDHAIPFYESFGFVIDGDGYMDGGTIPHHDMRLALKTGAA